MHERSLRLYSGLLITLFVVPHLVNHALGLISIDAMEAARVYIMAPWHTLPGQVALYGAFVVHFCLTLKSIYLRTTLKMPVWEALQISLGLLIVPLIAIHVIGTRGAFQIGGVEADYESVVGAIWSNNRYIIQQIALISVMWIHVVMGLHFWLRLKAGYAQAMFYLYALAILIPVLALLGFYRAGVAVAALLEQPNEAERIFDEWLRVGDEVRETVLGLEATTLLVYGLIIGGVLLARRIRNLTRSATRYTIRHPHAGPIEANIGLSILESLRVAGVPHASVCGGRGRCTTCRVRIGDGLSDLPAPTALEDEALQRINADPNVRLACQTRPTANIDISPVLPPKVSPESVYKPGGVSGREQSVAAMFIDLRGSTGIGEQRFPYDVVFILNQFFSEMSRELEKTNGHYAQFSGDGLMALYGLAGSLQQGCRDAIHGAAEMAKRMDDLNTRLSNELAAPLRIGIGIHCGEAIVGTMGPPKSPNFSAIGDTINIAARLEAQTKELDCMLVVSAQAAEASGIDFSAHEVRDVAVRGRAEPVRVFTIKDPLVITQVR